MSSTNTKSNKTILVFDLDNTLILRDEAMLACIENKFKLSLSLAQKIAIKKQDQQGHGDRLLFCKWLKQFLNIDEQPAAIWAALKNNIGYFVRLNHQAEKALKELKNQFELVLLTNGGTANQSRKIKETGLNYYFDADKIFISESLGCQKPARQIFEIVQNQFKSPATFYMIGDHWEKDILGAVNAGWKGIYLSMKPKQKPAKNIKIIHNLNEINQVLDEFER